MQVQIRLFAGIAQIHGSHLLSVPWHGGMTVGELRQMIAQTHPKLSEELQRALIAVNRAYATDEQLVSTADEIGIIPPVGGGSSDQPDRPGESIHARLTERPLDVAEAFSALSDARYGGTVVFSGTVREWTHGDQTDHLEYEAYQSMAIQQIREIESDIERRFPGIRMLCWHRLGRLEPTDVAVICGAAAPHRDHAFVAARELIDRVKQSVPIWKKEVYQDGRTVWQANAPHHDPT